MGKVIYEIRDLEDAEQSIIDKVDKALVAAAFKIRDNIRDLFLLSKSSYKYATKRYDELAKGIMVGKLKGNKIKIHALGNNKELSNSFKTRFFVGGTMQREGSGSKPYTKGYIKSNDAVDKGVNGGLIILDNYINTALNNI